MNRQPQSVSKLFALLLLFTGTVAPAQDASELPKLNIIDQLGIPGLGGAAGGEKATFSAEYRIAEGSRAGALSVTATMEPKWHLYSVTQLPGGPQTSVIKLASSEQAVITGKFVPDIPPHIKQYEFFDVPVEEHDGVVVWTAPIQLAEGVDPTTTKLQVRFDGQVCQDEGACIPIANKAIVAEFAGYYQAIPEATEFRTNAAHLTLTGTIEPATVRPGDTVKLTLTAVPEADWHVYAYALKDPLLISKPTLIVIDEPSGWETSDVTASVKPIAHEMGLEEEPIVYFHEEPVSWSAEITIPTDAALGPQEITGLIGYQTCTLIQCDLPTGAAFRGTIEVATATVPGESPLRFTDGKYKDAAASADQSAAVAPEKVTAIRFDKSQLTVEDDVKEKPLVVMVGIAFVAGFILNFMPCVLPVIGLKIMSFVQQAGESRSRAFALNLWYSLGLLSVFMVLATLAAVWSLGWGQQNQSSVFNVTMASVVFAMGLSFLGVWEIPIPGFVGSGKANNLAAKEGVSGAFAKGVVTTILAVPCSGPMIGSALTWCAGKPPVLIYIIFACLGLGMAAPYLLIGAYPALMRFMPKPGAWMDTFKQAMGFVLLGTVIWIMNYLPWPMLLPTTTFLFGLWAACWWIGRTSLTADLLDKVRSWAGASAFAAMIGLFAFMWLEDVMSQRYREAINVAAGESERSVTASTAVESGNAESVDHHLPWQPFTVGKLEEYTSERRTVMVDFTADWCPTCKVLEVKTLNTDRVRSVVEQNGVIPLLADWTKANAEISEMLELLGSKQIPVLAIFPADRPNEPIVLRGWYSTDTLIEKLNQAGPSKIAIQAPVAVPNYSVAKD
ncbi:MAG: thioredoxin family protein [Planctomycetaceae bacterium]|nr:thioredoxin family protein [Planctomycetales bacterium]MCB9927520.1 thioredoxin family protein [Planctomycetaceae bacterium]